MDYVSENDKRKIQDENVGESRADNREVLPPSKKQKFSAGEKIKLRGEDAWIMN